MLFRRPLPVIASAAALVAGCQHAPPPPALGEGQSRIRFVEPPNAPPPDLGQGKAMQLREPTNILVKAEPILPLATPVYPKAALAGHAGSALVGVRITVDPTGKVSEIAPSLLAFSTPGPFAEEFRAAAEAAVAQWRFLPAEIRHLQPGKGPQGNEYWTITQIDKTEMTFDVSFTFNATGEVLSAPLK